MKKFLLTFLLISFATIPAFSDEVNLTPKNAFSGFNNRAVRSQYPQLHKPLSAADLVEEEGTQSIIGPKSVREMGDITPSNNSSTPMTYSQFPQHLDSSNTMMLMQGGMQNMFMGY